MENDEAMTLAEAACFLKVSSRTVINLINRAIWSAGERVAIPESTWCCAQPVLLIFRIHLKIARRAWVMAQLEVHHVNHPQGRSVALSFLYP